MLPTIREFLERPTSKPKLVVIYGPTACGKTAASLEIARMLGSEVIGADSRQIYRHLDIGTGKIMPEEMGNVRHHMIDILDPRSEYSVETYKQTVLKIIVDLHSQGKIPIICGGTGLYIDAIVYDLIGPKGKPDWELRDSLEELRQKHGNEYLWNMLFEVDPEYASELHPNNFRYVMRWLEVIQGTGRSKRFSREIDKPFRFDTFFFTPYDGDRAKLYAKINARIGQMFDLWLVQEVQWLLDAGYRKTDPGLNTIGYKEVIDYLEGTTDIETCKTLVAQHNRNYAKRQLTWFRKYPAGNAE